jgi:hypothetical protein
MGQVVYDKHMFGKGRRREKTCVVNRTLYFVAVILDYKKCDVR